MPVREVSTSSLIDRFNELAYGDKYIDTKEHLPYLRSVAKGNVLEIGTDVGNSTTALLLGVKENGGHLTSVDIKDCSHLFDDPQWHFYQLDSHKMARNQSFITFDVVYIDGDHSYEGVKQDIAFAMAHAAPNALILMHDVLAPQFPGVRQAFDEVMLPKHIREGSWGLGIIQC